MGLRPRDVESQEEEGDLGSDLGGTSTPLAPDSSDAPLHDRAAGWGRVRGAGRGTGKTTITDATKRTAKRTPEVSLLMVYRIPIIPLRAPPSPRATP